MLFDNILIPESSIFFRKMETENIKNKSEGTKRRLTMAFGSITDGNIFSFLILRIQRFLFEMMHIGKVGEDKF